MSQTPMRTRRGFNLEKFKEQAQTKYDEIYRFVSKPTEGAYAPFPESVTVAVADLLTKKGERTPYIHQAEVATLVLDEGKNVSLTTPTASGKTISFLAPALSMLDRDPDATVMLIYPMNALTQDQAKGLVDLEFKKDEENNCIYRLQLDGKEIVAGVLNGTTPPEIRPIIRNEVRLLLTNQVALHTSLLAHGPGSYKDGSSWSRFMRNLQLVVMDEAHTQHGIGGSHTALVMRRMMAMTEHLGGKTPQVILSTATIANAEEHAEKLTGLGNWAFVNKSGARTQERTTIICSPADHPREGRWSPAIVAENVAVQCLMEGRRVLMFCPTRTKGATSTQSMATRVNDTLGSRAMIPFHAELPSDKKAEYTDRILNARVQGVASTSVLQMGVDIGGMDDVIAIGYPNNDPAAVAQMAGRVGRTSPGRFFLILDENQGSMNTYLDVCPEAINGAPQSRTIYPENENLAVTHAACALLETRSNIPLVKKWFPGVDMKEAFRRTRQNPHASVDMLGAMGDLGKYQALAPDQKEVIAELGGRDALLNWHVGAAIPTSFGDAWETYVVTQVDLAARKVLTEPVAEAVYRVNTTPVRNRQVTILESAPAPHVIEQLRGVFSAVSGEFNVSQQTRLYKIQTWWKGEDSPGRPEVVAVPPDLVSPPVEFKTRGVSMMLDSNNPLAVAVSNALAGEPDVMTDALADVMSKTIPAIIQARPLDVDLNVEQVNGGLEIVFFDMAVGGMGWAETLSTRMEDWLQASFNLLRDCHCAGEGCPKCTLSPLKIQDRDELLYGLEQLLR